MSFDSCQLTLVWGGSFQNRRTPPHPLQKQSIRSSSLAVRNDETLNTLGTKTAVSNSILCHENLKSTGGSAGRTACRQPLKSEFRGPKPERRPNTEGRSHARAVRISGFGFLSALGFRASGLGFGVWAFALTGWWYCPVRPQAPSLTKTGLPLNPLCYAVVWYPEFPCGSDEDRTGTMLFLRMSSGAPTCTMRPTRNPEPLSLEPLRANSRKQPPHKTP